MDPRRQTTPFREFLLILFLTTSVAVSQAAAASALRIMPLGDSITRGSYFAHYQDGPRAGTVIGLANPGGGGWRKPLQDQLRAAGIVYDFVGDLSYQGFGHNGDLAPTFDPDHEGLAGFSNQKIIAGGKVPTPRDVLDAMNVEEIVVPDIVTVLERHHPDIILLMSGANGFDAEARDRLIELIGANSRAHLFVATIPPQRAPRVGWENVDDYNASLPATVARQKAAGHRITLVKMDAALTVDHLLADGVHPNREGLDRMAATWYAALKAAGYISEN